MKITSSSTFRDLSAALRRLGEAQAQVSSGIRVRKPSDDPSGTADLVRIRSALDGVSQHRRNIGLVESRMRTEEGVLSAVTDLLARARELAISQATETANGGTRLTTKAEADALLEALVQFGNTRHDGEYLFGGTASLTQPFAADGSFTDPANPPTGKRPVLIGPGVTVDTTHDGASVFTNSDVLGSLQRFSDALGTNDVAAIKTSITDLEASFNEIQILLGESGARSARLDAASSTLESVELNLKTAASDIGDINLEEAISALAQHQGALEAALFATSAASSLSLMDFLR